MATDLHTQHIQAGCKHGMHMCVQYASCPDAFQLCDVGMPISYLQHTQEASPAQDILQSLQSFCCTAITVQLVQVQAELYDELSYPACKLL